MQAQLRMGEHARGEYDAVKQLDAQRVRGPVRSGVTRAQVRAKAKQQKQARKKQRGK